MGSLFVRCPTTNQAISTGIETDPESLAKMRSTILSIACPDCGQPHELKMSETYTDASTSKDNLVHFLKPQSIASHLSQRNSAHAANGSICAQSPYHTITYRRREQLQRMESYWRRQASR